MRRAQVRNHRGLRKVYLYLPGDVTFHFGVLNGRLSMGLCRTEMDR